MVQDTRRVPPSRTTMLARAVPPTRYGRMAMLFSCGLMLFLFLPGLACIGAELFLALQSRPLFALFCAVCAVVFAIPHFFVIMWLDRNEREPFYLIITSLFWGGVMATGTSSIINSVNGLIFLNFTQNQAMADQLMASLSAPPVEEVTKGLALVFIYLFFTKEMDSILDGIVYGALVGLGFAVFENFHYYFTYGTATENPADSFAVASVLVYIRGVVTGLGSHVCFTALTGAGIGAFRVLRKGAFRWLLPPGALVLAILSHFAWNTLAGLFNFFPESTGMYLFVSLPLAVLFLQVPFLIMVLLTAAFALRHERKMIEKYLTTERAGIVEPEELHNLLPYSRKLFHSFTLLASFKIRRFFRTRKRQKLLVTLAFERWHMDREDRLGDEETAHAHAVRVTDIRRQLRALPLKT